MKKFLYLLIMALMIFNCGSKKKIITKKSENKPKQDTTEVVIVKDDVVEKDSVEINKPVDSPVINSTTEYIDRYKTIAIREMQRSGIPASITLAQGILESGSGKGRLAVQGNNHFGIKCHGWKGGKIYHDDDAKQECFRKYKNAERSFVDHSEFLVGRKRYAKLFKLKKNDYKGWARELRKAGYATDKKYPQKLISIIERYKLYQYDVVIEEPQEEPLAHVVEKGDTLFSIAKKYNTTVDHIKKMNRLTSNTISIGQIIVLNRKE